MATKAHTEESQRRTTQAVKFILEQNYTRGEWVQFCAKEYQISDRQADTYWKFANDIIKEKYNKKRTNMVEKHHGRLLDLYIKCVKDQEWDNARKVLSDIAKLTGVNEPDKKDITSDGDKINIVIK